jgi:hypothetical protein
MGIKRLGLQERLQLPLLFLCLRRLICTKNCCASCKRKNPPLQEGFFKSVLFNYWFVPEGAAAGVA